MTTTGLYRIPASLRTIRLAIDLLDAGFSAHLVARRLIAAESPHAVCGLIKFWLRSLREPLLTFALHDDFLAAGRTRDADARLLLLRAAVVQLPQPHRLSLYVLVRHLRNVAAQSASNCMKADRLATVIGPSLGRRKVEGSIEEAEAVSGNLASMTQEMGALVCITETMITRMDEVFEGVEEELSRVAEERRAAAAATGERPAVAVAPAGTDPRSALQMGQYLPADVTSLESSASSSRGFSAALARQLPSLGRMRAKSTSNKASPRDRSSVVAVESPRPQQQAQRSSYVASLDLAATRTRATSTPESSATVAAAATVPSPAPPASAPTSASSVRTPSQLQGSAHGDDGDDDANDDDLADSDGFRTLVDVLQSGMRAVERAPDDADMTTATVDVFRQILLRARPSQLELATLSAGIESLTLAAGGSSDAAAAMMTSPRQNRRNFRA
jgi:hypothetical protein